MRCQRTKSIYLQNTVSDGTFRREVREIDKCLLRLEDFEFGALYLGLAVFKGELQILNWHLFPELIDKILLFHPN